MKKLHYLSFALFSVMTMFVAFAAQAAAPTQIIGNTTGTIGGDTNTFTTSNITTLVSGLLGWFAWGVTVASVAFGLYAAFLFITAGGDDTKLKQAKDILIYAIIGIVVAILSFSIVSIAKSISGV